MERLLQSAEKEIDCLAKERAAFIGYCKSYISLRKGHAQIRNLIFQIIPDPGLNSRHFQIAFFCSHFIQIIVSFWKYYLSTAIAFFGVYLVWDTANRDRKSRDNKDDSIQYLNRVSLEEKTLVEVVQCFNTGKADFC